MQEYIKPLAEFSIPFQVTPDHRWYIPSNTFESFESVPLDDKVMSVLESCMCYTVGDNYLQNTKPAGIVKFNALLMPGTNYSEDIIKLYAYPSSFAITITDFNQANNKAKLNVIAPWIQKYDTQNTNYIDLQQFRGATSVLECNTIIMYLDIHKI